MIKLSIVIPVFNVEKYIEQCLLSCIKQDISPEEYEIIVVNDGSPDNSIKIVECMAKCYTNIKIINQNNQGLSSARNAGLKNAQGDYVWFVDSDDRIREYCLARLIQQCKDENLDMLALVAAIVKDGNEIKRFSYNKLNVVSGGWVLKEGIMQHCAQYTIYRREFLLKYQLYFYPNIFHEDSEFSPRAYYFSQRVGFTNEIIYLVTINPNSITRTLNYKKSFDYLIGAISIHNFQKNISKNNYKTFFHNHISLMINNAMANFIIPIDDENKRLKAITDFSKELYNNRFLFMHLCKSSIIKYKIEGFLFTLFPRSTMKIYKLLRVLK